MIFDIETKGFQTISIHPDSNWTDDDTWLVIPDGSILAEKIIASAPYFDCVYEGGVLVDVTPTERPEQPWIPSVEEQNRAVFSLARMQAQSLAVDGALTDDNVLEVAALFPAWTPGGYDVGDVRNHTGQVWQCCQGHDSRPNPGWEPGTVPALWSPYHASDARLARPWVKPTGAQDAYQKGEVMIWTDETIYRSKLDANVHNPGEYLQGWEIV